MSKPINKAFYEAWCNASKIPILTQNPDFPEHSILLHAGPKDEARALRWSGDTYFDGLGTKKSPFQTPAAEISAHFGIFEMWLVLHGFQNKKNTPTYIKVNDYIFTVAREGVVATNGRCTKLLV